ncbi:MAG: hypothetical protein K1X71_20500 [Pirellulales bacterium]|nr:hypothetical protein [Pirellulales bacterium]
MLSMIRAPQFLYLLVLLIALLQTRHDAVAAPLRWDVHDGGNGHYYEAVQQPMDWFAARDAAAAREYDGLPGHLLTMTSAAELDFIRQNLPLGKYWIGLFQDTTAPDFSEPAGGWRWVTGETFDYANWWPGEPNDLNGHEDAAHTDAAMWWNDLNPRFNDPYFYVEYEPIPEPAAIQLLVLATTLVAVSGWLTSRRRSCNR